MNRQELMHRILEVRYTDLGEEEKLCRQLLDLSEQSQDLYGCAFANVYLFDSILALGVYSECDFILSNAIYLCRENNYEELLLMMCNLVGLYYLKLNDEQTALQYFLEGMQLAETLGDFEMISKLNNNIGTGFANRDDCQTAKTFFEKACETIELFCEEENDERKVSYLSNLAEIRIKMGELEGMEEDLMLSSKLSGDGIYNQIRIGCAWCSYYEKLGKWEQSAAEAEKLLKMGIEAYENRFFTCDMLYGTTQVMIDISAYELAEKFLNILEDMMQDAGLLVKYRILNLKISYMEKRGNTEALNRLYREYYDLEKKMMEMDDQMCAQSIFSRIQLNRFKQEREAMNKERQALELASNIDELTGLYNRRYFNKLVSKITQDKEQQSLAVIMADVDYFKEYNDFYGHYMGDKALKDVAKVLTAHAKEGIDVSRYGGDEFVCICSNMDDNQVEAYVKAVYEDLKEKNIPHEKSGCEHRLTLSIGWCNGRMGKEKDVEQLLQRADDALYKAKESGRNGYHKEEW